MWILVFLIDVLLLVDKWIHGYDGWPQFALDKIRLTLQLTPIDWNFHIFHYSQYWTLSICCLADCIHASIRYSGSLLPMVIAMLIYYKFFHPEPIPLCLPLSYWRCCSNNQSSTKRLDFSRHALMWFILASSSREMVAHSWPHAVVRDGGTDCAVPPSLSAGLCWCVKWLYRTGTVKFSKSE